MIVAASIAAVVGVVVGVLIGHRTARSRAVRRAPATPFAGADVAGADDVLTAAMDHLEMGVVISSPAGSIVYRNRAASTLEGTHAGVLVDEHIERALTSARAGEHVVKTVELHGPPAAALAVVAAPMPDGAGIATIQDVSERMRADAIRTDFVANISHELKTPVGAIAVLAEMLVDELDPAVVRRVANRMVDESHRVVRTIDDLLELSRIESARGDHDTVDLDAVVQAAIARGRVIDPARGIRIDALDDPGGVLLRADGRQLISALGNLVENAVKYSNDHGSVQVRTRIGQRFVEVMVVDHGVGVPERDLARIFERFYRVDRARSRETGGTGLGLAIVRHVAQNHGGDVVVSSTEGEGSTFTLRLPAALVVGSRAVDAAPQTHPAAHDRPGPPTRQGSAT